MRLFKGPVYMLLALAVLFFFTCKQKISATTIPFQSEQQLTVGQWERFERAVTNARNYADPYKDVQLNVVYTMPGGKEVAFWGFYDGGQTWRIRFMPHVTGLWSYKAVFSDDTPGISGEFNVTDSELPGMLSVCKKNPLWFGSDNNPVLIRGLHVGDRFFAANWQAEKRTLFLDWTEENGYNLLSVASHYLNRDQQGRGKGWDTPDLWPLNAEEFRKLEIILDDLADRRIYVYPFAGFFGQGSDYPTDPVKQEQFVRYTLARIGPYWNILLNVAGPEPNLPGEKGWMSSANVERLGRLIRDLDIFDHPLSVHNATGDDPYINSDWTTFGTLQGPKTLDRKKLSEGLLKNHHPAKPLLAQETLWPGNKYHPLYTDDDLRKNAIVILMSATNLVYGDFNGDSSTGFSGTMELIDKQQKRHDILKAVWDFFGSIPFCKLSPRQDLVSGGYCLALPGSEYLVYLENGGMVDVKAEGGPFKVTWINARNTNERVTAGNTISGTGLKAPGDVDWFVWLKGDEPHLNPGN